MRTAKWLALLAALAVAAMGQGEAEKLRLLREAVAGRDWTQAARWAGELEKAAGKAYEESLAATAGAKVEAALRWLPVECEGVLVAQARWALRAGRAEMGVDHRAELEYAAQVLAALPAGALRSALEGKEIGVTVAGFSMLPREGQGAVAVLGGQQFVYVYFFTEPLREAALPPADETRESRPTWRFLLPAEEGQNMPEQPVWIGLAEQGVLVAASEEEMLAETLRRRVDSAAASLFPQSAAWGLLDRGKPFWGLRRPASDGHKWFESMAFHVAADRGTVQVFVLQPKATRGRIWPDEEREYTVSDDGGVWKATTDLQKRGDIMVHRAVGMAGGGRLMQGRRK